MTTPAKIESVGDLPEELGNRLSDLGPQAFAQLMTLFQLGALGSAIASFVPNQRLDRVAVFVGRLKEEWSALATKVDELERDIREGKASERARLLLDGAIGAAHATSDMRAKQLGRIVAQGISADEVVAQKARTVLSTLEDLTDLELRVLLYFGLNRGREYRKVERRTVAEQLSHDMELARIFEDDVAFWVACITKLEGRGLLRKSTTWGGQHGDDEWPSEKLEAAEYSPAHYSITTLGHLLLENISIDATNNGVA